MSDHYLTSQRALSRAENARLDPPEDTFCVHSVEEEEGTEAAEQARGDDPTRARACYDHRDIDGA